MLLPRVIVQYFILLVGNDKKTCCVILCDAACVAFALALCLKEKQTFRRWTKEGHRQEHNTQKSYDWLKAWVNKTISFFFFFFNSWLFHHSMGYSGFLTLQSLKEIRARSGPFRPAFDPLLWIILLLEMFLKTWKFINASVVFGGLGVACWPLVPKFAGSNPAEAVGFLRAKISSARLPSEGK